MASGRSPDNVRGRSALDRECAISAHRRSLGSALLFAGIADHLQARDAQIAGFLGFCFLAFFPFHLFFLGFLRLGFMVTYAGNGHRVADVLVQFDGFAAQFPGLAILTRDCKFIAESPFCRQPVTVIPECLGLAVFAGAAVSCA